jgi:hypothetical protein
MTWRTSTAHRMEALFFRRFLRMVGVNLGLVVLAFRVGQVVLSGPFFTRRAGDCLEIFAAEGLFFVHLNRHTWGPE